MKKSVEESRLQYGSQKTPETQKELRMRDVKSWKPHDEEEVRSSGDKSVDGVPSVQNPLGSSIIIPHDS